MVVIIPSVFPKAARKGAKILIRELSNVLFGRETRMIEMLVNERELRMRKVVLHSYVAAFCTLVHKKAIEKLFQLSQSSTPLRILLN